VEAKADAGHGARCEHRPQPTIQRDTPETQRQGRGNGIGAVVGDVSLEIGVSVIAS
jgi:hypothetical protein